MTSPGLLYVTMAPKEGLSLDQFHDWYNNEHGPTRLRLPQIFSNGLRYQATDGIDPPFLALYDVVHMPHLVSPVYTTLRENRTPREAETIGQVKVNRLFFDLVDTKSSPDFAPIESYTDAEAEGSVLVVAEITLKSTEGAEAAYTAWMQGEHVEMLSRVPGWRRTRLFRTSRMEGGETKLVGLHDYAKENGLGGPAHLAAMDTPLRTEVFDKYVQDKSRRTYSLFYTFGPGPRDLQSLSRLPAGTPEFVSSGSRETATLTTTITSPGPDASISSYVQIPEGLTVPYVLEGNPAPDAPVVAFSNSLLTSKVMWDPFVAVLKTERPDLKILRFDTRGRHAPASPPVSSTLTLLSDDIKDLLDALRIPKLHALIGVSMGGATALKFALNHPTRLSKFVACDFNVSSSAANTEAWKERTALAESDGGKGIGKLAAATVGRWFHPTTVEKKPEVTAWMTRIVAENDVEGFRYGCRALWDYDLKPEMVRCSVPGLLVVGEADGKGALVRAMEGFKDLVGPNGAELKIVPETGHLPMSEDAAAFWEAIREFV